MFINLAHSSSCRRSEKRVAARAPVARRRRAARDAQGRAMLCAESVAAALTAALKTVGKSPRGPPPPARRPLPLAHAAFARGGPGLYERRRAAVGRRRRRRRERRRVVPAPRRVRVEHAVMVVPRCVQLSFKQMRAWSASGARRAKCRGTRRIVSTSTAVGTGRFVRRARARARARLRARTPCTPTATP